MRRGLPSLLVSRLPGLVPPLHLGELRGAVHSPEACAEPASQGGPRAPQR